MTAEKFAMRGSSSSSVIRIRLINEFETDHAYDFFSNGSVITYMFENDSHEITNIH